MCILAGTIHIFGRRTF